MIEIGVALPIVACCPPSDLICIYSCPLCRCDGLFINGLRQYIENDVGKDAATAAEEGTDMKYLKRLLDESVRDLDRYDYIVDDF